MVGFSWNFQKVLSQFFKLRWCSRFQRDFDLYSSQSQGCFPANTFFLLHEQGCSGCVAICGKMSCLAEVFALRVLCSFEIWQGGWAFTSCSLYFWPLESNKIHTLDILYIPSFCAINKRSTCVLWWAHACVVVDSVHTGGVVLAVVVLAVVDVDLAFVTFKAFWTHTPLNEDRCRSWNQLRKRGNLEDFHRHNYPAAAFFNNSDQFSDVSVLVTSVS